MSKLKFCFAEHRASPLFVIALISTCLYMDMDGYQLLGPTGNSTQNRDFGLWHLISQPAEAKPATSTKSFTNKTNASNNETKMDTKSSTKGSADLGKVPKQWTNQVSRTPSASQKGSSSAHGDNNSKKYLRKGEFEILGAGCISCIRKIEMDLRANGGVELVKVAMNVQPPVVTVIYDMDKVKLKELIEKIEKEGYGIRNQRDSFHSSQTPRGKQKGIFSQPELQPF